MLFEQSHITDEHVSTLSAESLLDVLLVLYDECCNSSFKKEKTVKEFVESGEGRVQGRVGGRGEGRCDREKGE